METNKMETRDIFPLLMSMSLPMVLSMLVQYLCIVSGNRGSHGSVTGIPAAEYRAVCGSRNWCRDCFRLIDQSGKKGSETGK